MRGKEGDFFSSCKPFQLCSGLRTETGREREQSLGAHTFQREKEKEGRGTGIAWHFVSFSVRSREQEKRKTAKTELKGRERVLGLSAGKEGEDAACKQSLDWSWEGCLGLCPLDTVPQLAALPCSPAWSRTQPPVSIYPQMPSFTPASPPPRSCLLSIYCTTSPLELWMI